MMNTGTWIALTLGLSLVAGVTGCGSAQSDQSAAEASESGVDAASDALEGFSGELRFEVVQSPTAHVRFYWSDGAPLVEFTGNLDEDTELLAVHSKAQQATSLEEIHHILAPGETTPAVLLAMDEEAALVEEFRPTEFTHIDSAPEDTPQPGTTTEFESGPSQTILAAGEATDRLGPSEGPGRALELTAWDWNDDATWWKNNFCNASNNKRCKTNKTWSYSGGFCAGDSGQAVMSGISASFESNAEIRYFEYSCGQCWLIATCCSWSRSFTATATPRQWRKYTRTNTSGKAFEVEGLGSTPRVHDANSYATFGAGDYSPLCPTQ